MKRDRLALLLFAVTIVALCSLCFFTMARWRVYQAGHADDPLLWLRTEFKLSDAEISRIRVLHEGYKPKCQAMCARIAAKKAEAAAELATATAVTPSAAAKLKEAADLHAECQAQMLDHFYEVSRAMPAEQGRRYLAEMKRFVLDAPGAAGHEMMQMEMPGSRMASLETDVLDQSDMARLAAGHDAALNDLMERHATRVFHFLCRLISDEDEAADLAQEVFVRVYRHRQNYRPGHKFTTWLYTIATNLARNHAAWRARRPNLSLDAERNEDGGTLGDTLPAEQPTPGDATESAERAQAVRAAVEELPADMRATLLLFEFEDKSMAEVAEILGISVKAVESRLFRARQQLRERLPRWLQAA